MATQAKNSRGWAFPTANARKAHFFIESRSLCGKFAYWGEEIEDDKHESADNCAACKRKREKLTAPK
jgi:hypothetical protein